MFSYIACMLAYRFLASLFLLACQLFVFWLLWCCFHVCFLTCMLVFRFYVLDEVWLLFWCCFHASFLTFMLPYVFQKLHVNLSCLSVPGTFAVLFWCCFHVCFLTCMLAFHFSVSDEVWLLFQCCFHASFLTFILPSLSVFLCFSEIAC